MQEEEEKHQQQVKAQQEILALKKKEEEQAHSESHDIFVVIEDASDIISASQIFICGLLVGRSHGALTVSEVILLMAEVNKIQDLQVRQRLDHMLLTTNNVEEARRAIDMHKA